MTLPSMCFSTLTGRCSSSIQRAAIWVRFVVTRVAVSPEKPHGLDYSLTLHGPDGERLVGFDNAHPVEGRSGVGRRTIATDCGRSGLTNTGTR